ncbi:FtsK/SpoIIIE domain-containing protein [Nocardia sp. alder85J]|uniref:FtsK/SpoIIIE domain-containing protein n=1 Tax=Nocardia sp. alder85J TaxID=2862949 RepID=UPI001CD34E72|nr:FtsK/SpoIIIE domain-containing protein [Nocardia sp. alder85J]MCX4093663.1 FtsK/SpoIIIE domain-containing protein [Nocardia sp. alder85J]
MARALITGGTVLLAGAKMLRWSRTPAKAAAPATGDYVAAAPVELRPAVLCFCNRAQEQHMWLALGLGSAEHGFPHVTDVVYTTHGLDAEVQLRGGQNLKTWTDAGTLDALAQYIGVPEVTAVQAFPGFVRLQVRTFDVLAAPAPLPAAAPDVVDLEAVPIGIREDGGLWRLRLLYGHTLVAGAMGSGKGSVIWSILAGIGPAIKTGLVDVWMADPKGGAEFGRGEDKLFVRFTTDSTTILAMLAEAVDTMRNRLASMRAAGTRKHVPTADEPLILIIIDEAASLSSYATREEQQEFRRLTGLLLSQGRAAAVSVVAALQDPSKETMPNRQLFPIRVGLRLDEPTQTAMVHGQGARDRGARCDRISENTPGVAFVGEDGTAEFVRVRAFWVDDATADAIVATYSPAPVITGPSEDYSGFDPDDLGDDEIPGDGAAVAA